MDNIFQHDVHESGHDIEHGPSSISFNELGLSTSLSTPEPTLNTTDSDQSRTLVGVELEIRSGVSGEGYDCIYVSNNFYYQCWNGYGFNRVTFGGVLVFETNDPAHYATKTSEFPEELKLYPVYR